MFNLETGVRILLENAVSFLKSINASSLLYKYDITIVIYKLISGYLKI